MDRKVSVIVPAHNEEENIKIVIEIIKKSNLVDEIIVVDNLSIDKTAQIARDNGAKVISCDIQGKGYAMEEGLKYEKNDIIVYLDGDVIDYPEDVIDRLVNPILSKEAEFVKSWFDREGGRVTELVAKPLLKIIFPDIYQFRQPLSGMIAGKKQYFEKITFEKDYGVDIGILLDMMELNVKIKEVYIGKIKNVSKEWKALEKMSTEVMKAILKRANKFS